MPYTDAQKVANYLGVVLTASQQTQAGVLADAATAWIERYTGKSWQQTSPVTDELHAPTGDRVYLTRRPVAAITTVKTRAAIFVGGAWTTLGATQYELLDAANGVLLIMGWSVAGALVSVTYTHAMTTAPADVRLAATMIASAWLFPALHPEAGGGGIASISVGQNDVAVKYAEQSADAVPVAAKAILNGYRQIVIA